MSEDLNVSNGTANEDLTYSWPDDNDTPDLASPEPHWESDQLGPPATDPGQTGPWAEPPDTDPGQLGSGPEQSDLGGTDPGLDGTSVDDVTEGDYPDVVVDGQMIGDPQGGSEHWFKQAANGFCLPSSLAQIISDYTGVDYTDESAFVGWANESRLLQVGTDGVPGIAFPDGIQLLERAGVPATLQFGDLDTLAEDLAEGRGVVLFVDSGEIWQGEAEEDDTPDHAVRVTGIDTARGVVILSDPGSTDGDMEEVPIATFTDAWADSQNSMIVCDQPEPDVLATEAATPDSPEVTDSALDYALQCPAGWVLLPVYLPAELLRS